LSSAKSSIASKVEQTRSTAKNAIASLLCRIIEDDDHLMLDDSSTSLYISKALKQEKKNLTVITNSVEILTELADAEGWTVMSTGGRLKPESMSLVGNQAQEMLRRFHVDRAIFSCKGLDTAAGITDSSEFHSSIKQSMLASARQVILALDSSKFNKTSFVTIANLTDIHMVVTDRCPDAEWLQLFAQLNITCEYPK